VHRYHEAQVKAPPFDVIEFEKRLRADASNDYADTDHDDRAVTERPAAAA
jgi:hypothetical protein